MHEQLNVLYSYLVGQYGAVSSLDLNADGTRLLCGYAKGLVHTV